ncbi:MAG TPA: hypothetical protein VFG62_00570 [Rhodopila sp.]|jgi:hypothetical protein|nr:hypothetical protein [Rhodopila sp.]
MRRLLLSFAMLGMLLGLSTIHAHAATAAAAVNVPQGTLVVHADYYHNHHHYHHRQWSHGHWHYY